MSDLTALEDLYRDLHAHPELGFAEVRTSAIAAQALRDAGYTVHTGLGGTGVAGVLERGAGPSVLLRADMDALPVTEQTGLPYASTATATFGGETVGVMHACGHDMHTTALIGAATALAADPGWQGRLIIVFQPAEEGGAGARAMLRDGLYDLVGRPDIVLGQHVGPIPAGALGVRAGAAFAGSDTLRLTVFGRGGHGSRPESTIDPIVIASAIVTRLQSIVAREVSPRDAAVVTVGSFHAGTAPNVIPDSAELGLSVRSFDPEVRARVLASIERIAVGEASAAGAERMPVLENLEIYGPVINDPDAAARTSAALQAALPGVMIVDPGPVTGSEDVGDFATEHGVPLVYWLLGGADPAVFAGATTFEQLAKVVDTIPSNHSPLYAPLIEPTLQIGVGALRAAALEWLAKA